MIITVGLLLSLSFLISLLALAGLIWAIVNRQMTIDQEHAYTVFAAGEAGRIDDPTVETRDEPLDHSDHSDTLRAGIDPFSRRPVLFLLTSAIGWLILGSVFGVMASLKFNWPDWLVEQAPLTFGRLRTLHLNLVIYGWLSMAGIGVALWVAPRIFHERLRMPTLAVIGAVLWNIGVAAGAGAISVGWNDGEEWLEIPWQIDILIAIAALLFLGPLLQTALHRNVQHIYVTGWYYIAAFGWLPVLLVVANLPYVYFGAQGATTNWWFAHNVLGLWLTPLGVGTAYYFIPKIIGKPIYSYALSLLGFWALALFYSQVGIHHLIGGPVPTWLATLSIVHSVMMFIPVIAVAINHHVTVARNLWAFRQSIPLRFVSLGALGYTLASFQGSTEALRSVNTVTHFTQYTVGHAHLGVYGFVSMVMFGSIYHMVPRITGTQWPYPPLMSLHFWLAIIGFGIYFVSLTIGGIEQGMAMLDATRPFADSVRLLAPYLAARSVGGTLMTLGHLVFVANFFVLLARTRRAEPLRLAQPTAPAVPS